MPLRTCLITAVLVLAWAGPTPAAAPTEADLQRARADLARLGREVEQRDADHDRALDALARADREVAAARRARDAAVAANRKAAAEASAAQAAVRAREKALARERRALAASLRVAWQTRQTSAVRTLLDGDDPARAARLLAWQRHLAQVNARHVAELRTALAGLAHEQARARERQASAEAERERAQAAAARLETARQVRARAAGDTQAALKDARHRQARAQADAQRLQALLAGIAHQRAAPTPTGRVLAAPDFGGVVGTFASQRGRLPWPLPGRLVARYGQVRTSGQTRWQGALIAAAPGSPVRAVHAGTVVYADALRGFGQLVIVDHGGGYLSLYGYNAALHRAAGDAVKAGDVLAEVGAGLTDPTGLYFEIRAAGKPVDPALWCRG